MQDFFCFKLRYRDKFQKLRYRNRFRINLENVKKKKSKSVIVSNFVDQSNISWDLKIQSHFVNTNLKLLRKIRIRVIIECDSNLKFLEVMD